MLGAIACQIALDFCPLGNKSFWFDSFNSINYMSLMGTIVF